MARSRKKARAPARRSASPAAPPQALAAAGHGAFTMTPEDVERALLTGASSGALQDYFGSDSYSQLRDLSRDASTRTVRGGPRVLILPGIMGSTLGKPGPLTLLWINPLAIALGRLTELALNGRSGAVSVKGVVLLAYLKLKLRLKIAGFDADFFPYDWRLSLTQLGASLAAALDKEPSSEVHLVAHSMGGLVARAALLAPSGAKVKRLIMLGTPNYGSYA